jgi:protein phosphatase
VDDGRTPVLWNNLKNAFKRNEESAGLTDVGLRRNHNEDAIFLSDEAGLYLVADGMGGLSFGEVASAMVVETVSTKFITSNREKPSLLLEEAILEANRRIFQYSQEKVKILDGTETLTGPGTLGTTIVALALSSETASVANVGDSRAYRLRNDRLERLTEDHTLAAMQPPTGEAPLATIPSRLKHILTRAVGVEAKVKIDLREERVRPGDLFLLCSDGLTNMIPDARIEEILSTSSSIQSSCETLIKEANRNGGKDNISCVLIRPR